MEKFTSLLVDWKELVPVIAKSLVLVARDTYRDATQLRVRGNAHIFFRILLSCVCVRERQRN